MTSQKKSVELHFVHFVNAILMARNIPVAVYTGNFLIN